MILKLDFDSEVPIYLQIKNQIIIGIANKELQEGDELPSVRGLAEDIGVNMHTVNKSYALLKDEGYIKIDRRKGAIISLNFSHSNELFENKLSEDIGIYVAECINRGISLDKLKEKIEEMFNEYEKEG
ncbi:GntR family transcriptional regulator [Clostridium sp.]|uniref:GntR family transcriptional regulator n=1 Tax=Clostridium sp. TaxID=1506 RepID=UPI0026181212|nr:GntR family transcriptional regulator [Clostridium sp.]